MRRLIWLVVALGVVSWAGCQRGDEDGKDVSADSRPAKAIEQHSTTDYVHEEGEMANENAPPAEAVTSREEQEMAEENARPAEPAKSKRAAAQPLVTSDAAEPTSAPSVPARGESGPVLSLGQVQRDDPALVAGAYGRSKEPAGPADRINVRKNFQPEFQRSVLE